MKISVFSKKLLVFLYAAVCGAVLAATALPLFNPNYSARAEEGGVYLRITSDDAPFYSGKTAESPLFYLPYTYYVRVISRGELFTYVEYGSGGAAIDGYVPTEKLFFDGLTVENPYPSVKISTATVSVLYKDWALNSSLQYVFEGRELFFYGKYFSPQGKPLYYVGYNDRLGYVKEEDLVPFDIPPHPNELTFLTPEPTEEPSPAQPADTDGTESVSVLRIAIFAFLGLAGVISLIFAVNKKPKPSPAASYYDENDYE